MKRRLTLLFSEGMTMVTYQDLIDFAILIVTLVGLCYEIFKNKK